MRKFSIKPLLLVLIAFLSNKSQSQTWGFPGMGIDPGYSPGPIGIGSTFIPANKEFYVVGESHFDINSPGDGGGRFVFNRPNTVSGSTYECFLSLGTGGAYKWLIGMDNDDAGQTSGSWNSNNHLRIRTGNSQVLRIENNNASNVNNGYIYIGTDPNISPTERLYLDGNLKATGSIYSYGSITTQNDLYIGDSYNYIKRVLNNGLRIGTFQNADALQININGNIGIGLVNNNVVSPSAKLTVQNTGGNNGFLLNTNYATGKGETSTLDLFTIRATDLSNNSSTNLIRVLANGQVGIGTTNALDANYKLSVNGGIRAKMIKVETGWADYVFEPNYRLRSLEQLEEYIKTENHLPEIPTASEVEANGVDLGLMESKLLMKIEELTLYTIQLNKQLQTCEKELLILKNSQGK